MKKLCSFSKISWPLGMPITSKTVATTTTGASTDTATTTPAITDPPRRGRGRPRKYPIGYRPPPVKRGKVGRPRKVVLEAGSNGHPAYGPNGDAPPAGTRATGAGEPGDMQDKLRELI